MHIGNVTVTQRSWCERVCGSVVAAVCVAPLLLVGAVVILGWNEKRDVCSRQAILQGKQVVVAADCDNAGNSDGELVAATCTLERRNLQPLTPPADSDFATAVRFVGTGLNIASEMLQCVQEKSSKTQKKSGGGTETITVYTTRLAWVSQHVDSSSFAEHDPDGFYRQCDNQPNPQWPMGVPRSQTVYAPAVDVGAFTIQGGLVQRVPLPVPVIGSIVPPFWSVDGSGMYSSTKWQVSSRSGAGTVRVSFKGNDWGSALVTVLGENREGYIVPWAAPATWLCSGYTLEDLRMGRLSIGQLFDTLDADANQLTWVLRCIGLLVLWVGFCMIAHPLGVAADCVPCVGPWLGDQVDAVICCVSFLPACSCCLGVVGIVWVALRPLLGVPLLLLFVAGTCGAAGFKAKQRQRRGAGLLSQQPLSTMPTVDARVLHAPSAPSAP